MSRAGGRINRLGERRVPRGALVALCALIIAGPAALVLAADYRYTNGGLVIHHHTDDYTVWNGVGDGDTQLASKIDAARQAWRNGPSSNGLVDRKTIGLTQATSAGSSQISFNRLGLGQNNAKVVWSTAYHDAQTTATFNVYYSNQMSGTEKQGRACNVIGNILGIHDNAGVSDCVSDPTQHTEPGANVLGLADDFYGPNIAPLSGTMKDSAAALESGTTYNLTATASGHAMARVDVFLDDDTEPIATSSTTTPCSNGEKCSRTVTLSADPGEWSLGSHTLHVVAKNEFGVAGGTGDADLATKDLVVTVVDGEGPELDLVGDLVASQTPLVGNSPGVDFQASDLSGVESVALFIDNGTEAEDEYEPDCEDEPDSECEPTTECPSGNCQRDGSLVALLDEVAPGQHSWKVVATDGLGNTTQQTGTMTVDPHSPELAVAGDLVDADGETLVSELASADIVATDSQTGDSGVSSITVDVDDETDLTDDQDCDPACPSQAQSEYTYDSSEWEEGEDHWVTIRAKDSAGNVTEEELDVDIPTLPPAECPQVAPDVQESPVTLSRSAAADAAIEPAVASSEPVYSEDFGITIDPTLEPGVDSPPDPLAMSDTLATGSVDSLPASAINLDYSMCLMPLQTTAGESGADGTDGDVAVHANSATDTDTIVRPTAAGVTAIQSIRGQEAPATYSWKVGIPEGSSLEQLSDGGVAVVSPSEEAGGDTDIPDAPPGANDADAIPDAATQLADQQHAIASAEVETGHWVLGVIEPPFAVDGNGASYPASLSLAGDIITATPGAAASALVLKVQGSLDRRRPPDASPAYPLHVAPTGLQASAVDAACDFEDAQNGGHDPLIFDFGRADKYQGHFGAGGSPFHKNGKILEALKVGYFAYDVCRENSGESKSVQIIYGNNNNELSSHVDFDGTAEEIGRQQARVMKKLRPLLEARDGVAVAGDIETGWDRKGDHKGLALVDGAQKQMKYFDFGTAGTRADCPPVDDDCDWSYNEIGDASQKGKAIPLPEIYYKSWAKDWAKVANIWAATHGGQRYVFGGVTSEPRECGAGLTQNESWRALQRATNRKIQRRLIYFNPNHWGSEC